jgi:phospholipid/cholesterol/gamma-HCH transport system substrate-binding protein
MNNQLKLGFFMAIGLIAIAVLIIATSALTFERTYNIYVNFNNISGLTCKSKIKIAGVNIGVIKGIILEDSKAKLKLSISKNIVLHQNAYAHIVSVGIIGTKYIDIFPGDKSFPILKEGDFIASRQDSGTDAILNITDKINNALYNEKYGDTMKNLAETIHSLKTIMNNIEKQNENITMIISNFSNFSANLASILEQNKNDLRETIVSIKDISEKMNILITRIYSGDGMISTLINDEQMSEDLKGTLASAKETINTLNSAIKQVDILQLNWNYTGTYDYTNAKYRNDIGITIMPRNNKFYYVGISNAANSNDITDQDEKKKINTLDALLGFRSAKAEVYGGILRNTAGLGIGYSFFQPIYAPYRMLKANLDIYNFIRDNHGPEINASVKLGLTKWLYLGLAVEDIAYKAAVMPYVNIEINDKDLASLFGIAISVNKISP